VIGPGNLVKVCLPEGRPNTRSNILCWVVPSADCALFVPTARLKRFPVGAIGMYVGYGNNTCVNVNELRVIILIEDELVSILPGNLKKIGAE